MAKKSLQYKIKELAEKVSPEDREDQSRLYEFIRSLSEIHIRRNWKILNDEAIREVSHQVATQLLLKVLDGGEIFNWDHYIYVSTSSAANVWLRDYHYVAYSEDIKEKLEPRHLESPESLVYVEESLEELCNYIERTINSLPYKGVKARILRKFIIESLNRENILWMCKGPAAAQLRFYKQNIQSRILETIKNYGT